MQGTIEYTLEHCCNCGMPFYITTDFYNRRHRDHGMFYCPHGHGQHYSGKTEAQKLREQLEAAQISKKYFEDEAARQRRDRERAERRVTAMKGQVTKANNKLKKGICPCCEEQFPDLETHIQTQHPDFDIDQSGTTDPVFEAPKAPPVKKRGRPSKAEKPVPVK